MKDQKKRAPRGRRLAATALILLASLALVACVGRPQPKETIWVDPDPNNTAQADQDKTPIYTRSPMPSSLKEAADAEPTEDDFGALPKAQQLAYLSWLNDYEVDYAARFLAVTGNPADVLPTPSVDNTAEEILTLFNYNLRLAESYTEGTATLRTDEGIQDENAVRKAIIAITDQNGSAERKANQLIDEILRDPARTVDYESTAGEYLLPKNIGLQPIGAEVDGLPTKYIHFTDPADGQSTVWTFGYVEFTNAAGETDGEWIFVA